jgi:hypothetical protein
MSLKLAPQICRPVRVNIIEPEYATQLELVHKYAFISLLNIIFVVDTGGVHISVIRAGLLQAKSKTLSGSRWRKLEGVRQ